MVSGKVLKNAASGEGRHHYSGGCGGLEWEANDEAGIHLRGVVTSLDRSLLQSGCKID